MKFGRCRIALGLLILLLLVSGGTVAYFSHEISKRRQAVRFILREGERLQSRNKYEEAAALYEKGISIDPNNPDLYFRLGECSIWTSNWPKIGSSFERVLQLQPANTDAAVYLAKYYRHETGDLEKARTILLAALQHTPRHAPALDLLGSVEYERQEYEASRKAFEQAIQAAPARVTAYCGLGRTLVKLEELQAARETLQKALQIDPDDPDMHYLLGQILMRLGARKEGREHIQFFKEAEKKRTDIKDLRFLAHTHADNPGVWYRLGVAYLKQQDYQGAIRSLKECVSVDPGFVPAHSILGSLFLREKSVTEAFHHLLTAVQIDPESANDHNNLGVCYMLQSRYKESEQAFLEALRLDPSNSQFAQNLAAARAKLQETGP